MTIYITIAIISISIITIIITITIISVIMITSFIRVGILDLSRALPPHVHLGPDYFL